MNILDQPNDFHINGPGGAMGQNWNSMGRTSSWCFGVLVSPNIVYFSPFSNVSIGETIQFPNGETHSVTQVFVSPQTGLMAARLSTTSSLPFTPLYSGEVIPPNSEGMFIGAGLGRGDPLDGDNGWRFGGPDSVFKRWHSAQLTVLASVGNQYTFIVNQNPTNAEVAAVTFSDLTAGCYFWIQLPTNEWRFVGYVSNTQTLADYLRSRYLASVTVNQTLQDKDFLDTIISGGTPTQPGEAITIFIPAKNTQLNSSDTLLNGKFNVPPKEIYVFNESANFTTRAAVAGDAYNATIPLVFGTNTIQSLLNTGGQQYYSLPRYIFRTEDRWPDPAAPRGPMTVDVNGDILWKGKLYRINQHLTV